jgi:hypothetical protein
MTAKRKPVAPERRKPFRTEYGAGMFPGFPRTIEGAMKSMWSMIVERREYNNGAVYERDASKKESLGRIRMTAAGWVIECPTLMKGRKIVRRIK